MTPVGNKKMTKKIESIRKSKCADKPKLILTLFSNNNNVLYNLNTGNPKIHENNNTKVGRDKLSSSSHCLEVGKPLIYIII